MRVQQVQQVARTQSDMISPWIPYALRVRECWMVAMSPRWIAVSVLLVRELGREGSSTHIDSHTARPCPCRIHCRSRNPACSSGPPCGISSTGGTAFFRIGYRGRTVRCNTSRYWNSHTGCGSKYRLGSPGSGGWLARVGGMPTCCPAQECVGPQWRSGEGNTPAGVTAGDSHPARRVRSGVSMHGQGSRVPS